MERDDLVSGVVSPDSAILPSLLMSPAQSKPTTTITRRASVLARASRFGAARLLVAHASVWLARLLSSAVRLAGSELVPRACGRAALRTVIGWLPPRAVPRPRPDRSRSGYDN
eukprot:6174576-Pleurochrysis_carterae.AAC.1